MRSQFKLTPGQFKTLQALATGLTNEEIAAELVLSARTVESHLTAIYWLTGINGRLKLVCFYLKNPMAFEVYTGQKASKKRQKVYQLHKDGYCNKDIAARLSISSSYVSILLKELKNAIAPHHKVRSH